MSGSVNVVVLVGNLTRDPELKAMPSGSNVCRLGLAVNERVKQNEQWTERANYFDIDVFGGMGENCAKYLAKGRQVAVEGRLRWRSWETQEGQKRSAVSVVANSVQFIGPRDGGAGGGGYGGDSQGGGAPFNKGGLEPDTSHGEPIEDDIPF